MRTDEEILRQTEELARELGAIEGWITDKSPEEYNFRDSINPRCYKFWKMACQAQLTLTDTDPNDCLESEEEKTEDFNQAVRNVENLTEQLKIASLKLDQLRE